MPFHQNLIPQLPQETERERGYMITDKKTIQIGKFAKL